MSKSTSGAIQCYVYDFSLSAAQCGSREPIISWLKENAAKWVFQEEMTEAKEEKKTGYHHWQGRVSLIKKKRLTTLVKSCESSVMKKCHWSITSTNAKSGFTYVMKADTRINGPWTDKDGDVEEVMEEINREVKEWYPWQKEIINDCKDFKEKKRYPDTRTITFIYDKVGKAGKSTLCKYLDVHKLANVLPPVTDCQDMLQMAMCMPKAKAFLIDIPRGDRQKPEKIQQMWNGIETLKNGYAYDKRHVFKSRRTASPAMYIFSNHLPDLACLSEDRWEIKFIDYEFNLVDYTPDRYEKNRKVVETLNSLKPKPTAPPKKRHILDDLSVEEIVRLKRLKTLSL